MSFYAAYDYINLLKTSSIVKQNTYYFLKQNKSQKSIVEELQKNNVKISYFEWRLLSFLKEKRFIPKAGEYLIPKNSTILDIQNIFHYGDTITRSFTLIEGMTASDLKKKLLDNKYLSGEINISVLCMSKLAADKLPVIIDIDSNNFVAWDHDIFNSHLL